MRQEYSLDHITEGNGKSESLGADGGRVVEDISYEVVQNASRELLTYVDALKQRLGKIRNGANGTHANLNGRTEPGNSGADSVHPRNGAGSGIYAQGSAAEFGRNGKR